MDSWPSEHILEVDEPVTEGGSQTHSNVVDLVSLRQLRICGEDLPSKTYVCGCTSTIDLAMPLY